MSASLALCVLLVLTKRWHGSFTMDHSEGNQKFYTVPTPRTGDEAFVAVVLIGYLARHRWYLPIASAVEKSVGY